MKKIIITSSIMQELADSDTIFKRGNIATFTANTCEEILNIQGARNADLIVVDDGLPLMGGAKLCIALRNDADLRNVSTILIPDGTGESLARCREARANAILQKPIDPVQLFSKISELLIISQRKDLRVLLRASVKGSDTATSFFGMSRNISISGMLLETDQALKQGDRFSCSITVSHREFTVQCQVMRAADSKGRFQYGVKFLNLDTKSLIIIDQFVKGGIKH